MTAILYGTLIGLLFAVAWAAAWTLCAKHSFWKMQATYLKASEEEQESARTLAMQEALTRLHVASAQPEDEPGSLPPPPPTPREAAAFGWLRKKNRAS